MLTGWWAYRLWGSSAALLAMALACFEPNLVAHSSLVTTDIGLTLFIFLSLYLFWEYLNSPKWWLLIAIGISTGMALVSKFSAILLIPTIASIIVLDVLIVRKPDSAFVPGKRQSEVRHKLLKGAVMFFLVLIFASLTIPPTYFFQGFQPWLFGFQRFLTLAQEGQPAFFLGEHSYEGWWNYFVVAFFIRTPLGTLGLLFSSLALYRTGNPFRPRDAIFLLLPVLLFFAAMTQAKVNMGVRHVLPVYPFLFVLAARLATVRFRGRWLKYFLVGGPLIFTAVSSLRVAPHQLAYFNEIVGGPDQGYRYLADSNDWGQDLKGVKAYMEKEKLPIIYLSYFGSAPPSYYGIRYQYVPGTWPLEWPPPADRVPADAPRKILAISVVNLQEVFTHYNPLFDWLWRREPVAKIGYSIFIYDLTKDREGLMQLEETYVKAGIHKLRDLYDEVWLLDAAELMNEPDRTFDAVIIGTVSSICAKASASTC